MMSPTGSGREVAASTGALHTDFTTVTEVPGNRVSQEAIDMVWTRYAFAGGYCEGKTVLELACGPGTGLGYLSRKAARLVAGDYTGGLLERARARYGSRIPLVRLDAHALPFVPGIFDVIVLFEAIYFLADAARALKACRAALTPGGILVLATANPGRPDFNPSPYSTRYFTGSELSALLESSGFAVELYGGFPVQVAGMRDRALMMAKRWAVAMHLVPKTMKGKELFKRLVFGPLEDFPGDIAASSREWVAPVRIQNAAAADGYKVLYAVARNAGRETQVR